STSRRARFATSSTKRAGRTSATDGGAGEGNGCVGVASEREKPPKEGRDEVWSEADDSPARLDGRRDIVPGIYAMGRVPWGSNGAKSLRWFWPVDLGIPVEEGYTGDPESAGLTELAAGGAEMWRQSLELKGMHERDGQMAVAKCLFPGGALDSQTTDSQWIQNLTDTQPSPRTPIQASQLQEGSWPTPDPTSGIAGYDEDGTPVYESQLLPSPNGIAFLQNEHGSRTSSNFNHEADEPGPRKQSSLHSQKHWQGRHVTITKYEHQPYDVFEIRVNHDWKPKFAYSKLCTIEDWLGEGQGTCQ
ncbi:hypothetical protein BDZ89DRAFT_1052221, partial [Hymenopellis radicata]